MKLFFLASLAMLFINNSYADVVRGSIKHFSGREAETGKPYSYVALESLDGRRVALPKWILGTSIAQFPKNKVTFEGDFQSVLCTDMSASCVHGQMMNIKAVLMEFPQQMVRPVKFAGRLALFTTNGVNGPVQYIAINSTREVSVPNFLNKEMLFGMNPEITIAGQMVPRPCPTIEACRSVVLSPVRSVLLKF